MKVLVTGAAGFIGGQLWHTLWQRGDEVVGIDNFSYGNLDNLKFDDHDFGSEVRRMDIRDREALPKLFEEEKFDVVYNIAGIAPLPDCQSDPVQAVEVNTMGLVHVLECARRTGVKQVVQASTNAMYENETEFPTVESKVQPAHPDLPQHQILRRALCPKLCRHLWHDRDLPALCQRLRPSHRLPAQAAAVCGLYDPRAVL